MELKFYKYQGTGNDFILIDNRKSVFDNSNTEMIKNLCDRKFGIGADGLITLRNGDDKYDFRMIYHNSDGKQATMCGNGGRSIVEFAFDLGIIGNRTKFLAVDGEHEAIIIETPNKNEKTISLRMADVRNIEINEDYCLLNTGSPHYVTFVKDLEEYNVFEQGKKIRYNNRFTKEGVNVNFLELKDSSIHVRTYERGVENETLSCGTGVTASALAASLMGILKSDTVCNIKTLGGTLQVSFKRNSNKTFTDIWLTGPAKFVFKGQIDI